MSENQLDEMKKDKVIARVRKMLALSNDSAASAGERENAMRMAHATLAKYNMSLGDTEVEEEKRIDSCIEVSPHAWARQVAYSIAQLYFCEYFFVRLGGQRIKHYFVGRESNVITAQEMTAYVVKSIAREARKITKENFADGKFERDFCKGATNAVWQRCIDIRRKAEQESAQEVQSAQSSGTAIVLASYYKQEQDRNKALIESSWGKLDISKGRQSQAGSTAFSHGHAYGSSVSLNKQVGGANRNAGMLK